MYPRADCPAGDPKVYANDSQIMFCERFSNYGARAVCCALLAGMLGSFIPGRAVAANVLSLGGIVLGEDAQPVADATVEARGQNVAVSTHTNAAGRFQFETLALGEYRLTAYKGPLNATTTVELTSTGTSVEMRLQRLKTINQVVASPASRPPVRGSGTDVAINQTVLAHSPASTTFPNLLLQLPGAARGANGVVHINGDHGDINYFVDGVALPQQLNRSIGTEFDVSNAAFVDVLEGAYPAEYGGRFAAVVNIGSRTGAGEPAGFTTSFEGGSYAYLNSSVEYHTPLGRGNLVVAVDGTRSNRALDPPDFDSPHDDGSSTNQFLRLTLPANNSDYLNLTLSHSLQTYQIPNYVSQGEPANTNDNEIQNDTFAALQYHHSIGTNGTLSFGPSFKRSQIQDFGDPEDDFTFGEAQNIANGGSATDCADAVATGNFGPTTCGYSLNGNTSATDIAFNTDLSLQGTRHTLGAGATYDITTVPKFYQITLQPGNFLAPIFTPATPDAPYTVTDNAPNVGHTESVYVQDTWKLAPSYELAYGVRADAFQLFSSQFQDGASQVSPRVKLTRFFGPRASIYVYYGRFFTPFSFQNVSPAAAQLLNLPLQSSIANFDLRPQRDSDYEIGGHLPAGSGDLGLRVMQKNATDLIDDTQVGFTNLHQDINYQLGRIATQTAYYQLPLARGGRFYASLNHTYSVNKGCETQLLAPCFGSPVDWTPADHEQRWGVTSGFISNDRRGGWFSVDGEYGSGLSSAACPSDTRGFCKFTPHIVFDAEKGFAVTQNMALTLRVGNVLNDRYFVTLANAQGDHMSQGRTFNLGVTFKR